MRISVVTVCRNAAGTIRKALESFFRQTWVDKELIVIDGASTDGTAEVARSFSNPALTVVSEPDRGLYDAMNKGLARFGGDVVGFLNADDCYHDDGALAAIAEALASADACYGHLDFIGAEGQVTRRWRASPWREGAFARGWMPAHPTFYCKRAVVDEVGAFDTRYRLAADYDFMLRTLEIQGFTAACIDRVLIDMGDGGLSSSGLRARLRHNFEALASRRRWLGAGVVDYALFAKPLSKASQFIGGGRPERAA